jgi:hypothetical protein
MCLFGNKQLEGWELSEKKGVQYSKAKYLPKNFIPIGSSWTKQPPCFKTTSFQQPGGKNEQGPLFFIDSSFH